MTLKASWNPTNEIIKNSNIYKMMLKNGLKKYEDFWKWSVNKKLDFWSQTVLNLNIKLYQNFTSIVDISKGVEQAQWLKGAKLNIVDSCFQNENQATAIIFQKENGNIEKVTQIQLENYVNQIANSIVHSGLKQSDYIAIYMPMTLEAVAIYLAGIKAGNPVVTIADSFTANEIEVRLKITKPKLLFTQDVLQRAGKTLPLYQKVLDAKAPKTIIIKVSDKKIPLRGKDIYFKDFLVKNNSFETVVQNPDDIITVLFSSGTTGKPKAIPWTHVTPIKSASDGYYHHNIKKNNVVCWPTNLGWMMGPWLVFAALINKASIALYYGAPMGENFGDFVQNSKVTMLGVVPSIVKNWKNTLCMEKSDWNSIQCFSSTGEASNPEDMEYLMQLGHNKPIIEYCGGTEIGGGYVTSTLIQSNIASTFSTQALGGEFILLDENNKLSNKGEMFLIPPIMGLSNTLLNRNHHDVYYNGVPKFSGKILRKHGDQLERLENDYFRAQGRADDAINLGGIKVSSIQIEAIINQLDFIKESAAIAISPKTGGPSTLIVYYVEKEQVFNLEGRLQKAKQIVHTKLNPLFKVAELILIDKLPRTASGKIMRRKLRDLFQQES